MGAALVSPDPVASATFHLRTHRSAEIVWSTLTCAEKSSRYFHGLSLRSSWLPGAPLLLCAAGGSSLSGQVLCAREPVHLSYTIEDESEMTTYVTWTIRPVSAGSIVRLRINESGGALSSEEELEDVWLPVLEGLRDVVGEVDPDALPPADRAT